MSGLSDQLEAKVQEIENLVSGMSEEDAAKPPAQGEWCAKEVLSHLSGPEAESFFAGVKRFLEEDTPAIDLTPGENYFEDKRKGAPVKQLLGDVSSQYREMARWVGGLSDEQLARKAHMPAFKETSLGEYPTLQLWMGAIINFHLNAHVQQLQALAAK